MKADELRQRIIVGHQNLDHLLEILEKLPKGKKRDEIGEKSIRLLKSLSSFEDGFIELNPGACLFREKKCNDKNKGTFVCANCPSYLNTIWGSQPPMAKASGLVL